MARKPAPQAPAKPVPAKPAPAKPAPARKAASRAAPARKAAAAPAAAVSSPARKAAKQRPRLVRDSFTMPESDFAVIATLKARALDVRRAAKKSELLRAGLQALALLEPKALAAALDRLEPIKTGRPRKGH
ncbi:MAG: hypothetical protein KGM91_06445 [Burkholderiales bacterium]|nr:hypothetical protein [Burkholderiales bacterium]